MHFVIGGILGLLALGGAAKLLGSAAEDAGEAVDTASNGLLKLSVAAVGGWVLFRWVRKKGWV